LSLIGTTDIDLPELQQNKHSASLTFLAKRTEGWDLPLLMSPVFSVKSGLKPTKGLSEIPSPLVPRTQKRAACDASQ
jgi:hypothetical protein